MEIREQIESDLRAVASSSLPSSVKKAMDRVIFRLRTQNSKVEIIDANDPFVFLFEEITKDKKLINESITILSTIRTLLEIGALDGKACTKIFSIIDSLISSAPESFLLKVLQISLASFSSPSAKLEPRITASRWIFQMTYNTQSPIIPNVATATSFQLLDVAFDKAMGNSKKSIQNSQNGQNQQNLEDFDNTAEQLVNQNGEQLSDNEAQVSQSTEIEPISTRIANPNDWPITYVFTLMNEILLFINNGEPTMFKQTFVKSSNFPLLLLKYMLDKHFNFLSFFQPQFKSSIEHLLKYIESQKNVDPIKFSMFVPHLVVNLGEECPEKVMPLFSKLISFSETYHPLLNGVAVTISLCPQLQFTSISNDDMLKVASVSSKFFLSNFKGTLSEPIVVFKKNSNKNRQPPLTLSWFDPFDQNANKILVSSVVILYQEILQCSQNPERFVTVFNLFDGIWQRVIQSTQDPVTLGTSLKIARQCVRYSIRQKHIDPAHRIFSTLCGFAVPTSAAFPLVAKGVIALHSIIRLLQQMKSQLVTFWPLIFETFSKCYHTASHKRSAADTQALKLIQPSLLSFSAELNDEMFVILFKVILKLSEEELKGFIDRKGTVPNFWPFKSLAYIFGINISTRQSAPMISNSKQRSNSDANKDSQNKENMKLISNNDANKASQIKGGIKSLSISDVNKVSQNKRDVNSMLWVEKTFFDHLESFLQCESPEYRTQATTTLFEISKYVISSKNSSQKVRQRIFDYIFQAANSNHRDVSIAAFSGLLSFLAGGTAISIREGWPMVLTILKVVWATPYSENIQNGFRVLTFICSDCLMYLRNTDIEVCLSTIAAYINQTEDINIALGTIGLLWNVGSSLSVVSSPTLKNDKENDLSSRDENNDSNGVNNANTSTTDMNNINDKNINENNNKGIINNNNQNYDSNDGIDSQIGDRLEVTANQSENPSRNLNSVEIPSFSADKKPIDIEKPTIFNNHEKDECWKALFKTLQNSFCDKRQNVSDSSLQTFFSLVNTFYGQFSTDLRHYVLDNVISPLVSVISESESSLLAIQGVTQCLRSLGDCQAVVSALVDAIESIALKFESGIKAGEATRCYIPFFFFDDEELSKKVTASFRRTVEKYVSNPTKSDLQGAVSVVTDILPKIASTVDDEEFNEWIQIIKLFCTFQVDKSYLHVSTHAALNVQSNLTNLSEERVMKLIALNMELIGIRCQPLTDKCFEILSSLFVKDFDEKGRAHCLIKILPLLQKMLSNPDCSSCFKKILGSQISLDILLIDRDTVCRLVEIGRRNAEFRPILVNLMGRKMNLIHTDIFPIFLSLGTDSPILFKLYFEKFCWKERNIVNESEKEKDRIFFEKTKDMVKKAMTNVVDLLIGEEKALESILRKQQYQGLIDLFNGLKELKADEDIFRVKGTNGHLISLLDLIIKLGETKSPELRLLMQEILHIVIT